MKIMIVNSKITLKRKEMKINVGSDDKPSS